MGSSEEPLLGLRFLPWVLFVSVILGNPGLRAQGSRFQSPNLQIPNKLSPNLLKKPEKQKKNFEAWVWRHKGPPLSKGFAKVLRSMGFSGISVDLDEDPSKAAKLGFSFYLDHAAGKGILHLRKKVFDEAFSHFIRSRSTKDLIRPFPLLSPQVRSTLFKGLRRRVGRALPLKPRWISLEDEISTTRFINPFDFGFDPTTLVAWKAWLKKHYGSPDRLAEAWLRDLPSFERVLPVTTDEVRAREAVPLGFPANLADWNARLAFLDDVLAKTVSDLCKETALLAPNLPVGIEGAQAPSAFGGYDYAKLLPGLSAIEAYDIGGTRELVRSLMQPGTLRFETIFPSGEGQPPGLAAAKLWDLYAHGLDGAIIWSAGKLFPSEDPKKPSPFALSLSKALERIHQLPSLAGARIEGGEIVLLESQSSVRAQWMLDSLKDGKTWIRRFGSYEATHSTSMAARLSWIRLLQDLGYAFRFVSETDLAKGDWRGRRPRVLILPECLSLKSSTLQRIHNFLRGGGTVIADELPGVYDGELVLRDHPPTLDLFGVQRQGSRRFVLEGKLLPKSPRLESGLGLILSGLRAVGITRSSGDPSKTYLFRGPREGGTTLLLNLAVVEYAKARVDPQKAPMCRRLRKFLVQALELARVPPVALVRVKGYPSVLEKLLLRTQAGRSYLVIRANVNQDPRLFQILSDRGPVKMEFLLPSRRKVFDLMSGKPLGVGRRFQSLLDPRRGAFFLLEEAGG